MRKQLFVLTIPLILSLLCIPVTTHARGLSNTSFILDTTTEVLENGDSITTILEEETSSIHTRATSSKSVSRTVNYRNADGDIIWSFKVNATFTYNGTTSRCTGATHSFHTNDSNWKADSMSSTYSGNTAAGNITAKHYLLGICSKTINKEVSIKCDAKGNIT